MFKRLGAAILLVEDLQKSIGFYRDTLELEIKNQSQDWVEFKKEGQSAVLALHPAHIKRKGFSNILVGFSVSNLESECKKLEGKHGTNLGGARLAGANLGGARLTGVDLSGADLNHTELTNSIIINPDYELLTINSSTVFNNATIDDPQFIDYISQYTRNVPQKIKDKKKLKRELAKKGVSEENIEELLTNSKIPEE